MDEKDPKELVENKNSEPSLDLDSSVPTMDASDDEKSAFFEQWKSRHQAYLEQQNQQDEEVFVPVDEPEKKKNGFLKRREKNKKTNETPTEITDDALEQEPVTLKKKDPLPRMVLLKAIPVLLGSLVLFLLSLYFITPFSKDKIISVQGNERLTAQEVEQLSLISNQDYIVTIALNAKNYAENIKKASPEISEAIIAYRFPNAFTIHVKEYKLIGYLEENSQYYRILSSGEIASEAIPADQLPETYLLVKLTDKASIKSLAEQLAKVDETITSKIQEITLTPSKVTADLSTLTMTDGNTILVPLSEIDTKLPYYSKIVSDIVEPSVIDMEVGIYRYVKTSQ
ncbi:FtsQ-type POTRA domain-containing protein [Streptococcus parasuis]|uniref:cell division protein FtsQ/DivIB n=1 Tax=Streptococcus parasuis TaxID=1501662 RepID=UPI0028A290AF|nr:FtsQ-type POTRA domain-containing protein [Streptococcus parasuis]